MSSASCPHAGLRIWTSARRVRTLEIPMLSTVRSFRVISIDSLSVGNLPIQIEHKLIMLRSHDCYSDPSKHL